MKRPSQKSFIEYVAVAIIAFIFSLLNLFHVLYFLFNKPPGTVFIGITHWYEDYFFYLSQLTQGAMGQWKLVNAYTLENIPIGFNWLFNLLLGKLSPIFNIPVWTLYDITIFILSIVYIILVYKILKELFQDKTKAFGALLIALTSTNWFFKPVTYFYAYTSAFNRLGGIAHHIAQSILSLAAMYVFAKLLAYPKKIRYAMCVSILLTALFVISSFYVAVDVLVMLVVSVYFVYKDKKILFPVVRSFVLILAPLVLLALYQSRVIADPFWLLVRAWEQTRNPAALTTFILSSGLILFLVPFGITQFLKTKTPLRIIGITFAILPILLYFSGIHTYLGIPVFRLLQPAAYVFLAAIVVEALNVRKHLLISLIAVFVIFQIPGLVIELQARVNEYYLNSHLNYLDRDVYDGLMYLKNQRHEKNVLAVHTLESFVPVISGHRVYEGHATLTLDYKEKIDKTIAFYTNKMSENEAYSLVVNNTIGFILWEKRFGSPPNYSFLKILYENPKLIIFTL